MAVTEGFVPFHGFRTWYKIVGEPGEELPLLVINGGPGCPHDYMTDLEALDRAVIFYDQLGCGRSDHPEDPALWVMDTFVQEVTAVREALGLERLHLLGPSFGAQVALEYVLTRPVGLASLTLAGPLASAPLYESEARRLEHSLPPDTRAAIARDEEGAAMAFYQRWLCRLDPWPDHLTRSFANMNHDVYGIMWGKEWDVTGNLKDWDVTPRLGELDLPVLITSGRHDLTTPTVVRPLADGIPGAEWVLFEQSSHLPSAEEPDHYREVLTSFLTKAESQPPSAAGWLAS
ncbi:proline iminopeptidase-family hydrolase [Streptomyces sp. NPDC054956]